MTRRLFQFAWAGVFLAMAVGCGGKGLNTYPVTGKLTVKGQPAKDLRITFEPVAAGVEPAAGVLDPDGTYKVFSGIKGTPGAMVGKYKVVITPDMSKVDMSAAYTGAKGPPKLPESPVPTEYSSAKTSPKEIEVKAENNVIDIDIP